MDFGGDEGGEFGLAGGEDGEGEEEGADEMEDCEGGHWG